MLSNTLGMDQRVLKCLRSTLGQRRPIDVGRQDRSQC